MNASVAIAHRHAGVPCKHPLTVDDFLILHERGVFESFAKAELIDGDIYTVNAIYRPHAGALADLIIDIGNAIRASGLPLKIYSPVSTRLDEHNLPEPDLVVATIESDKMVSRESIRLAIEVAESSLDFDLGRKASLYARAGVPEYWVVDLVGRKIVRMANAEHDRYQTIDNVPFGQRIMSITIPQIDINTAALA